MIAASSIVCASYDPTDVPAYRVATTVSIASTSNNNANSTILERTNLRNQIQSLAMICTEELTNRTHAKDAFTYLSASEKYWNIVRTMQEVELNERKLNNPSPKQLQANSSNSK